MNPSKKEPIQKSNILFNFGYLVGKDENDQMSSPFPFFVEELIASGVINITVIDSIFKQIEIQTLPKLLQKRINVIDDKKEINACRSILAPVFEELGVEFPFKDGNSFILKKEKPEHIIQDVRHILSLHEFLLGVNYQLQLFTDIEAMKSSIAALRNYCKNPAARGNLSIIEGILSTYRKVTVDSAQKISTAQTSSIDLLDELINDTTYRMISSERHSLGFPNRVNKSLVTIKSLYKKLLSKPLFKPLLGLSLKSISVATGLPMPDTDIGEAILKRNYFPPILPSDGLSKLHKTAHDNWIKQCSPKI